MTALVVTPLRGMPEVAAGDDLAALVAAALLANGIALQDDDVLVVSSKVTSKARGLVVPSGDRAAAVASQTAWVVAERLGTDGVTRVVKSLAGPVMAAAGVDASNTGGHDHLLLLPHDPDAAARELRASLVAATGVTRLGVVLSDTAGRAWRAGQTDFALGCAGLAVTDDLRGGVDADGRGLEVTTRAVADEIAAAADLVKGKAYAVPVAHLRGLASGTVVAVDDAGVRVDMGVVEPGAGSLVRTGPGDWFGMGRAESVRAALGVDPGTALSERVGIAATQPEDAGARLSRAVSTAIHDLPEVGVDVGGGAGSVGVGGDLGVGGDVGGGAGRGGAPIGPGAGGPSGPPRVVVSASDPLDTGIAVGRLLVALWGEWLEGRVVARTADAVTIEVTERG